MSTKPTHVAELSAQLPSFRYINREIRTLSMEMEMESEMEQTLVGDAANARVARLVKIYGRLKPLLTALSALPVLPSAWRAALALFTQALDAVAGGVEATFKAGKDLVQP